MNRRSLLLVVALSSFAVTQGIVLAQQVAQTQQRVEDTRADAPNPPSDAPVSERTK